MLWQVITFSYLPGIWYLISTTMGWQYPDTMLCSISKDREHHLSDEFLMCATHTEKSEKRSSMALYLKPFQVPLRLQAAGFVGTVHARWAPPYQLNESVLTAINILQYMYVIPFWAFNLPAVVDRAHVKHFAAVLFFPANKMISAMDNEQTLTCVY